MPHRKRRLLSLMDVAMGRVWVRLPRCSSKPLQAALRAGNPIDRTRTFIGTLLDPGYRDESAAIFKKEELARFMDGNLGVAYIMSGTQAGKTAGEDVARAFSLKHLQPRTLAPGEMLQEGQCVGCHVPPEKHEPGCSLDCLGPETHGPHIETMAAPPPDTPYPGPSAPTGEPINTCSAAPVPDKAKEQTIEEMCMTWKNAMPLHNASNAVNDHIRSLMAQVYDHSVAPRVKLINFLKQESATRLDDITKIALSQMQERKDATEQIKGLQERFGDLQAKYRELFAAPRRALRKIGVAEEGLPKTHEMVIGMVDWMASEIEADHLSIDGLNAQINELRLHPPLSANAELLLELGRVRMELERLKADAPSPGDRIITAKEHDKLLAIERGHQQDKTTARLATQENYSLHEQMKLITAALKRAGVEHPQGVQHIGVTDLATRYIETAESENACEILRQSIDSIRQAVGLDKDAWVTDILEMIKQRAEHFRNMKDRTDSVARILLPHKGEAATTADVVVEIERLQEAAKPIYGESPLGKLLPIYQALTRITDQLELQVMNTHANAPELLVQVICEEIQKLQKGQMQRAYMELAEEIDMIAAALDKTCLASNFTTTEICRHIHQGIRSLKKAAAHRSLTLKIAALRNIVLRKAPHASNCHPANVFKRPCTCWKDEFMAEADRIPEDKTGAAKACPHTHEAPTMVDCMRCGTEGCPLRFGEPNGQPYTAKGTIE